MVNDTNADSFEQKIRSNTDAKEYGGYRITAKDIIGARTGASILQMPEFYGKKILAFLSGNEQPNKVAYEKRIATSQMAKQLFDAVISNDPSIDLDLGNWVRGILEDRVIETW